MCEPRSLIVNALREIDRSTLPVQSRQTARNASSKYPVIPGSAAILPGDRKQPCRLRSSCKNIS